jgi:hypothetical protein
MTDEPSSDPSSDPGHEAGKPIALGGPITPSDEPAPFVSSGADHEPPLPEPESSRPEPIFHEPTPAPSVAPAPVPQKRSVLMPLIGLLGFVILAAAIGYLWVRPVPTPAVRAMPPDESSAVAALQSDVATLKTSLAALDSRETSDVAALHAAIAALPPPAPARRSA